MKKDGFAFSTRLAAGALALLLSTAAQATLIDRGNGMIFDSASNLTWLQDANAAQTRGADADGLLNWAAASAWVTQLGHGGFDDWRLPVVRPVNGVALNLDYSEDGSTDGGINTAGLNSELGYLFYTSLGNQAATGLTQTGPFVNAQNYAYWTGTASPYGDEEALHFFTAFGDQGSSLKLNEYAVWAVREGDVLATVPEPQTAALLALGLGLLAWRRHAQR